MMKMDHELPEGTRIGERFVVERLAGKGGMGAVYRAKHEPTGEPVALKVLQDASAASVQRFLREAEVLSKFDHPGIVRYVANGQTARGEFWLAMQWLSGEDLGARLEREGLRVSETLALASRIAGALAVAHASGVVHRDIKPSNVFLPEGRCEDAVVLDFGISRPLSARTALTRTGMIIGTPGYMAPEQLEGKATIDARADVFSMGALLFECLTGKPAFPGEHLMAVLARLLMNEAPRVFDVRDDVPAELSDLVSRMLARDVDARPANGGVVAEEIARIVLSPATRSAPRAKRSALTASEQRLLSVVVALSPAITIGGGGDGGTDATVSMGLTHETVNEVRASLRGFSARVDVISGALLVSLSGEGNPADRAAEAARVALVVSSCLSRASIVVVTSRADGRDGSTLGPVVDRAAFLFEKALERTLHEARPSAILLDDITRALLDARFEVVETNGIGYLVSEHQIAEKSRFLLGRPSPIVGREREIATLLGAVEEAAAEQRAHAVLVTGPPGIGKSRIRHEFCRRLTERLPEALVWVSRGDALRKESANYLLGAALRQAAGIVGSEPPSVRHDKLFALCGVVPAPERARVAAMLGEMVGANFADDVAPILRAARLEPAVMAAEIRRAWIDFLCAKCDKRPLCLVLEDLHWADASSVALLDRSLVALADKPFCVIALARREVHDVFPKLWSERPLDELRLSELNRRAAEKLVRGALGEAATPSILDMIMERAAGNPFCLEELVRAVAEGREASLPETVLGMVEARLLSLSSKERRVLRAASVFGEVFWSSAISALTHDERSAGDDVRAVVDSLVAREVIDRRATSRFSAESEWAFRHAFLRDGAYAMLTDADRALGHRLAGEWLERVGEADPMVLAEHYERSDEPQRSGAFFSRASERALGAGDYLGAINTAERGLRVDPEGLVAAELYLSMAEATSLSGDIGRAHESARRCIGLAVPGSRVFTLALAGYVTNSFVTGNPEPLLEAVPILVMVEPTAEARGAFAWALSLVAFVLMYAMQPAMAAPFLDKLERLARESEGDPVPTAWHLHARGTWAWLVEGNPYRALKLQWRASELLEEAGRLHHAGLVRCMASGDLLLLGAFERCDLSLAAIEPAMRNALVAGSTNLVRLNSAWLRGDHAQAFAYAEALLDNPYDRAMLSGQVFAALAGVCLDRGDLESARKHAERADAELQPTHFMRVLFSCTQAGIALAMGDAARSLALAEEGLALARMNGVLFSALTQTRLARVRALDALGRHEEAREALRDARLEISRIAGLIEEPELQTSFLERIPENVAAFRLAAAWNV